MTATSILVRHALSLQWHDIPHAARERLKMFLLDTIAVGIAGVNAPYADGVWRIATRGSRGNACILGRAERMAPAAAAFVNAYQIHAQEFDCVHEAAVLHPFSVATGAMAAVCSTLPAIDGRVFGAALCAAVDIAVGLGLAARGPLKFFRPATTGIFAATAGVARLRGLNQAYTEAAFGHALAFASGTMQAHLEGTPGLPLQVAAAASNAVVAVDLAQQGIPAALSSIDGPFGYLSLFESDHDLAPTLAALGHEFAVSSVSHKPYPTGRAAHGGIAAVQRLLRMPGIAADRMARLRYVAPSLIARLVGRPAHPAMSVNYARLCLPYLAARTLLHGTVGLDAFSPAALEDPATLALAGRITVEIDDNPDIAAFTPAYLQAEFRDGSFIRIDIPVLPGSVASPLDEPARLAKVADCLAFGGLALSARDLATQIDALDETTDMPAVLSALSLPGK